DPKKATHSKARVVRTERTKLEPSREQCASQANWCGKRLSRATRILPRTVCDSTFKTAALLALQSTANPSRHSGSRLRLSSRAAGAALHRIRSRWHHVCGSQLQAGYFQIDNLEPTAIV